MINLQIPRLAVSQASTFWTLLWAQGKDNSTNQKESMKLMTSSSVALAQAKAQLQVRGRADVSPTRMLGDPEPEPLQKRNKRDAMSLLDLFGLTKEEVAVAGKPANETQAMLSEFEVTLAEKARLRGYLKGSH
jgi:hypothetical protein